MNEFFTLFPCVWKNGRMKMSQKKQKVMQSVVYLINWKDWFMRERSKDVDQLPGKIHTTIGIFLFTTESVDCCCFMGATASSALVERMTCSASVKGSSPLHALLKAKNTLQIPIFSTINFSQPSLKRRRLRRCRSCAFNLQTRMRVSWYVSSTKFGYSLGIDSWSMWTCEFRWG